jgi:hypothetical protein
VFVDVAVVGVLGEHLDNEEGDRSGDVVLHGSGLQSGLLREEDGIAYKSSRKCLKQRKPQPRPRAR